MPADSHSGKDTYMEIDGLLTNRDPNLNIVSPYIGPYYARMLLGLARRKNVRIITSEPKLESSKRAVAYINSRGNRKASLVKWSLYMIVLEAILTLFRMYPLDFYILPVFILGWLALYAHYRSGMNLRIRMKVVTKDFIHEKLFISDTKAIVGSANLTYGGTHKNIEHIEVISDPERIRGLADHFESLWSSY
ncbi:MAG: hypothetical protein KGH98_02895 [Candidatus Micrarchaeota archaeon]|nr:hypothetical protein [Candidatus Micrarchaeota archaeon]